jgi:flagellar motility protein MotE (MotC chaperone)
VINRIRLLPITIFLATLMLTVKLGDIWNGATSDDSTIMRIQPTLAQKATEKEEQPATKSLAKLDASEKKSAPEGMKPVATTDTDESEIRDISNLSSSEIRLLQELGDRRRIIDRRARQLNQREALLKAAEQRLVEKQAELNRIKVSILDLLAKKDEAEKKRLSRLVGIYSNMKPKDAANIFNELDLQVLLDVMQNMKERKLAPIVAAMDTKRARTLTRELAERGKIPEIPK